MVSIYLAPLSESVDDDEPATEAIEKDRNELGKYCIMTTQLMARANKHGLARSQSHRRYVKSQESRSQHADHCGQLPPAVPEACERLRVDDSRSGNYSPLG